MEKSITLNRSVVFIDESFSNIPIQTGIEVFNFQNPFQQIFNLPLLKILTEKEGFQKNPNEFCFDNLTFKSNFFPPKFIIQEEKAENNSILFNISKKIIETGNLKSNITKIGINFEFFFNEEISLEENIVKDNILKEFDFSSINISKEINNNLILNLKIIMAEYQEKKGVVCAVNFENKLNQENTIDDIFSIDYKEILKNKTKYFFS